MSEQRILIIRTGGLGDGLMLWPALCALRRKLPQATIHLLGHRSRLALLEDPLAADLALDLEGSGLHLLYELDAEPPDEVRERFGAYDAVIAFAAAGDYALAENLAACGAGEVHAFLPFPPEGAGTHAADHLLAALAGLDLTAGVDLPALPQTTAEVDAGRRRLDGAGLAGGRIALLAPGSGSPRKNWPADRFAGLARALADLGLAVALLEGPADGEAVAAVRALDPGGAWPVLADAEPALLKALIGRATLFVGNDAGPTHLAGLLGVPTAAVFGPTEPATWRPLGARVEVVRAADGWLESVPIEATLAACRRLID